MIPRTAAIILAQGARSGTLMVRAPGSSRAANQAGPGAIELRLAGALPPSAAQKMSAAAPIPIGIGPTNHARHLMGPKYQANKPGNSQAK